MMDGAPGEIVVPATERMAPAPLLLTLLEGFHGNDIGYCYWKSSRRVEAALCGASDLDLLVARADLHRACAVLLEKGFKEFPSVAHRAHPAITSFLGYDEPTGQIVHVHLHFRLVVGEKLLKLYRLAWEDTLLARAVPHRLLPVLMLDPASEALLLVVRACLELRRRDPVALRHWNATRQKFGLDREALARQVDPGTLRARAREVFPAELADLVTDAVFSDRLFELRGGLRRRLRQALAERRAYNAVEGHFRSFARAVFWAAGGLNDRLFHAPRPWSRRVPGGGYVVAVLGVDGSGKSTAVRSIHSWLGAEVDVVPVYFGTGDGRPSLLLLPFKGLSRLVARCMKVKPRDSSHGNISNRDPSLAYSVLMMGWAAVVALEKRGKLLAAHRGAARGLFVVTDRYPQNIDPTYSDGPLLHRLKWAPGWLRRFETRSYELAARLPPDLVIKLDVEPETLARREPEMNAEVIRQRIEAFRRLEFPGACTVSINAQQPLADVLHGIKREVWRIL